ncbi:DUF3265 domain-containing protein [Vibrio alginolyticus]|nr:DUF3265 domain-containing protein [Vibrio alginolyticus]
MFASYEGIFLKKPNKLFKSDSQRVAFLICVAFSVKGGMRRLGCCVAHTLTGRYALGDDFARFIQESSSN